jgi:hypothetical protein
MPRETSIRVFHCVTATEFLDAISPRAPHYSTSAPAHSFFAVTQTRGLSFGLRRSGTEVRCGLNAGGAVTVASIP